MTPSGDRPWPEATGSTPEGTQGLDVAAVVVNYNARAYLPACVASLRSAGVDEIVVVDNGSTDGSEAALRAADPSVRWESAGRNRGYGAAANLGAARAAGHYLLVANADLVIDPGAVAALVAKLDANPQLALVGPRIVNPDGSLYPSARTFPDLVDALGHGLVGQVLPGNRFTRRYRLLDWDHLEAANVDWVSGACFVVRRSVWEQLGGFDPSYFMYLEDVDLCWRIRRLGWTVGYEPTAEVMHVQGVSTSRHPYRMLAAHHRSMWQFAWRTTTGTKRLALPVVALGLLGRLPVTAARHWLAAARSAR